MSELPSRRVLAEAVLDPQVRARYEAKIVRTSTCWWWTGALMRSGHGRFWVTAQHDRDVVVIAHRFGYALTHGTARLAAAVVLGHRCDEALCQNPDHLEPVTTEENRDAWLARQWRRGSPLRDVRGRAGRARAIRDALRGDGDWQAACDAGVSELDKHQLQLW